jgi:hypothetical protein
MSESCDLVELQETYDVFNSAFFPEDEPKLHHIIGQGRYSVGYRVTLPDGTDVVEPAEEAAEKPVDEVSGEPAAERYTKNQIYMPAINNWSTGCVMTNLKFDCPPFLPGHDDCGFFNRHARFFRNIKIYGIQ